KSQEASRQGLAAVLPADHLTHDAMQDLHIRTGERHTAPQVAQIGFHMGCFVLWEKEPSLFEVRLVIIS
ncbi:MAG: hypothetical protein RLZ60_478, partial [Pseudomonadota bacterium]